MAKTELHTGVILYTTSKVIILLIFIMYYELGISCHVDKKNVQRLNNIICL